MFTISQLIQIAMALAIAMSVGYILACILKD